MFIGLKSIPWHLPEFYYNRSLQRSYTNTSTILQETINGFLCPLTRFLKVTGDSLLIHEFAYSLFIGFCSENHSYYSIKLIHCGAPQRDVLSDKMVFLSGD